MRFKLNKNLEKLLSGLNLEAVKEFYTVHTLDETCKEFNISGYYLNMIINMYGWKEGRHIHRIGGKKAFSTRIERMGGYDNVKKQIKNNCIEGRIRKHGSLEEARKSQAEKSRKHFQDVYGVDNPMQLEEIRAKVVQTKITRYGSLEAAEKIRYERAAKTNLERYGCENVSSNETVKKRRVETNLNRYGVTNTFQLPEARKHCVDAIQSERFQQAKKFTCLVRYGSWGPMSSERVKRLSRESCIKRYGVDNVSKADIIKERKYNTMLKNGTFATSSLEEYFYSCLLEIFPVEDIKRQYKDIIRYPYRCDFYIVPLDLFIEIQGTWLHGPHPYDSTNVDDITLLESARKKQGLDKKGNKNMYYTFEEQWTCIDITKRNIAIENKLNFVELYNRNEMDSFLIALKETIQGEE